MKVDLVETTDYLSDLADHAGPASTAAIIAPFVLVGSMFAFGVAESIIGNADRLMGPGAPPIFANLRLLLLIAAIATALVAFCPLFAAAHLRRVATEVVPVRYIALAEGITIDLPEGDTR